MCVCVRIEHTMLQAGPWPRAETRQYGYKGDGKDEYRQKKLVIETMKMRSGNDFFFR